MGTFPSRSRFAVTQPVWYARHMARNQERRRPSPDELAGLAGRLLPGPVLRPILGRALQNLGVSLCLHRVAARPRPTDWQPGLSIPAPELDALIELLLSSRPGAAKGWLSVTFDDGYRDAAEYLRTRAPRFPDVEFLFFVCPEKAETRAGFRWDLVEESLKAGRPNAGALLDEPVDLARENLRPELRALTSLDDYALSTVEELRALREIPNLQLGNHTDLHRSPANSPDALVKADFERSTAAFTRLFGPPRHFAFPFGTPRHHFAQRHVDWLRGLGDFPIWTTEARPYRLEERAARAVLPRFPVDGNKDALTLAGWIAARSLDFKVRGTKHHFAPG